MSGCDRSLPHLLNETLTVLHNCAAIARECLDKHDIEGADRRIAELQDALRTLTEASARANEAQAKQPIPIDSYRPS